VRKVELHEATDSLAEYVRRIEEEPVIIVHKGVALAALIPLDNVDYETVQLSTNPKFIELLERSRARFRKEGGISSAEMRRKFGEEKRSEPPEP
jgi:antitoxin (DNA-binding transcriptional repressor) of toxin-antitoxin stability system